MKRNNQEDLQRLRGFPLIDDDFMTKVFEDIQCAELLLRIILNDEGIPRSGSTQSAWHQEFIRAGP